MCAPIVGVVLGAAGSIMQGIAGKNAANANADAARQNAMLAREQANNVERQKARNLTELHEKERQTLGTQRVAGAGNGLDMQGGSGLGLLQSTEVTAQRDEDTLIWNAAQQKWGYDADAIKYDNQADQFKAQGANAMTMGILGAATTVAGAMYDAKQNSLDSGASGNGLMASRPASVNATGGLVDTKWNTWRNASTYNKIPTWGR